MGKQSTGKKEAAAFVPGVTFRQAPNWPLLALSLVGMALAGYLSWTALTATAVQGCAEGGGCDAVLSSRWATLLGVPTAVWGVLTYLALAGTAFIRRAETQWLSSTTEMALHPAYQGIIGMGAEALPLILTELQARSGYWYWALKAISGEDPVPPEDRGAVPRMKEAWLKWGLAKGLISA